MYALLSVCMSDNMDSRRTKERRKSTPMSGAWRSKSSSPAQERLRQGFEVTRGYRDDLIQNKKAAYKSAHTVLHAKQMCPLDIAATFKQQLYILSYKLKFYD